MNELVLGGVRSGKSGYAEQQAQAFADAGQRVVYIATAEAGDGEMGGRIALHRQSRPSDWQTIEQPLALADAIAAQDAADTTILVDCLTLWLTNCLLAPETDCWSQQKQALLALLPQMQGNLLLVSNEVGWGVVPMGELSRRFCDEAGWLHQALVPYCERVTLVVAGLPQSLKQPLK